MYREWRMADAEAVRPRVPKEFSARNISRRWSDPCPSYCLGRFRPTPTERDTTLDFFADLKKTGKPKVPSAPKLSQPEEVKPEPEIPKPELAKKLHVTELDLLIDDNTESHHTNMYECTQSRDMDGKQLPAELVIRRGQEFKMAINFDRPYDIKKNDITLIFKLGDQSLGGTKICEKIKVDETKPTSVKRGKWRAQLMNKKDKTLTVSVFIPASAPVGEWQLSIRTIVDVVDGKDVIWQYLHNDEIIVLFNPWCKEDVFYVKDEEWLNEAVLNDSGGIYIGSADFRGHNKWFFGQFENGILHVSLHLLRKSFGLEATPAMGNGVRVVRALSKIVNSNDDQGLLSGNWSGNYEGGVNPSDWVGSVKILREYAATGRPVKYGQCWVFSGVLTTVCRALGIPCRSVTNFESAHNSDLCHLSCDVINRKDANGDWHEEHVDSVWNFHVWNEVWMSRPDLAVEEGMVYDGWQVIDATPQETSEGVFQCGPSPLAAIKEGNLNVGYDTAFIFAEVNGDRVEWSEHPKTKILYQMEREKDAVGKNISTHAPTGEPLKDAEDERLDITNLYKYEEGSAKEREIVRKAERLFRCANIDEDEDDEQPPPIIALVMALDKPEKVKIGEAISCVISVQNTGDIASPISLSAEVLSVDYRRRNKGTVKTVEKTDVVVQPQQKTEIKIELDVATCLKYPQYGFNFKVNAMMEIIDLDLTKKKSALIRLETPSIETSGPEKCRHDETANVELSFENPLSTPLTECLLKMEGGLKLPDGATEIKIGSINPNGKWEKTLSLKPSEQPRFRSWRSLYVTLATKELGNLYGSHKLRLTSTNI